MKQGQEVGIWYQEVRRLRLNLYCKYREKLVFHRRANKFRGQYTNLAAFRTRPD